MKFRPLPEMGRGRCFFSGAEACRGRWMQRGTDPGFGGFSRAAGGGCNGGQTRVSGALVEPRAVGATGDRQMFMRYLKERLTQVFGRELAKRESEKRESAKRESEKRESEKRESEKRESAKPESEKYESAKPEVAKPETDVPTEFMLNHMACDFAETVRWWMNNDRYLPEDVSRFFFSTTPFA